MPAGWRDLVVGTFDEVAPYRVLPPGVPDPTPAELEEIETLMARHGGVAHARVVQRYWHGFVTLTPEQRRSLTGLP